MEKVVVLRAGRMLRLHVSATTHHALSRLKGRQLPPSHDTPSSGCGPARTWAPSFRSRSRSYLLVGSLSLSAILTKVAKESACILRMTLPRWTFTVISLVPSSEATCLLSIPVTTRLHDLALSRGQFVIALPQFAHFALLLSPSAVAFECLLNCIQQVLIVERFRQKLHRAGFHRLH